MRGVIHKTEGFVPEKRHIRILQEVATRSNCPIEHIVLSLVPSLNEQNVRFGVGQLLVHKYLDLCWGNAPPGFQLRLTSQGQEALKKKGLS